jgi:hypothetical protein
VWLSSQRPSASVRRRQPWLTLTAHAQAQQDNWELTIITGPRTVQRIFEITCTIDRLPFAAGNARAATP